MKDLTREQAIEAAKTNMNTLGWLKLYAPQVADLLVELKEHVQILRHDTSSSWSKSGHTAMGIPIQVVNEYETYRLDPDYQDKPKELGYELEWMNSGDNTEMLGFWCRDLQFDFQDAVSLRIDGCTFHGYKTADGLDKTYKPHVALRWKEAGKTVHAVFREVGK